MSAERPGTTDRTRPEQLDMENWMTHDTSTTELQELMDTLANKRSTLLALQASHAEALRSITAAEAEVNTTIAAVKRVARESEVKSLESSGVRVSVSRPKTRYVDLSIVHDHPEVLHLTGVVGTIDRSALLQAVDTGQIAEALVAPYLREKNRTPAVSIKYDPVATTFRIPDGS